MLSDSFAVGVQSLNEFAAVSRRKLRREWPDVAAALAAIQAAATMVHPLTVGVHQTGMRLAERYGFSVYDALIVACALDNGGRELLSEDLHDGLVVDGRLTIRNPFGENLSSR